MPHCKFSYEYMRREAHHNATKAEDVLNAHIPDAGWINRSYPQHGANENTEVGPVDRPVPPQVISSYFNCGHNDNGTKVVSAKNALFSPLTDGTPAGRLRGADVPGSATADGDARLGAVAPFCNSEQSAQHPASNKKKRRNKYFRNKKKRVKDTANPRRDTPPPMLLKEEEDWEEEYIVTTPYGPEDMLHFALQDLILYYSDPADLPATATYSPAVHHPPRMPWCCSNAPVEPLQFADAEE
ncbi:uncharacterized protein LOC119788256 [Cyprinodon tularosa]|uniref:uncharacterized protein LOC119788256 n=1 Tax=Cyprinodon tularosa TaxID=77115 RepID=UPI0018E23659|nr:uncharacterized protein LOC119788256 [Cyprinodon tularosa]